MRANASRLMGNWVQKSSQTYIAGTPPPAEELQASAANSSKAADAGAAVGPIIKAGTIMFGVLDTTANSDNPGPLLGHLVSGPLKGARLMGTMRIAANSEGGTIQFNLMNVKGVPKSITVNAFAIDPGTARTALASRVNNHYLLRYGSLFAASLLEGVGKSVQKQGTSITTTGTQTSLQQAKLSPLEYAIVGLGEVGQEWGSAVKPQFALSLIHI